MASVPVHVVEDHDEALAYIHRAIASKILPFKSSLLVHFDSHPDLLSPDINADEVTDKEELYRSTSIADWILPLIYMGHIGGVVWVKPPWAHQIPNGRHDLVVGKDKKSGHIRVATPLPYFIGELLWVPRKELINISEIPLHVVTLHPLTDSTNSSETESAQHKSSCSNSTTSKKDDPLPDKTQSSSKCIEEVAVADSPLCMPSCKKARLCSMGLSVEDVCAVLSDCLSSCAWILDVDLDFFSTGNPYREIFSAEQYSLIQRLYRLTEPRDCSEEALSVCCRERQQQLEDLEQMWCVKTDSSVDADRDVSTSADDPACQPVQLSAIDRNHVVSIKKNLWTYYRDSFVDPEYLHTAGIVSDLPVHISDAEETDYLMRAFRKVLERSMRRPAIVTISRSTEDEYTPAHQVEHIQDQVCHTIRSSLQDCGSSGRVQFTVLHEYLKQKDDSPEILDLDVELK